MSCLTTGLSVSCSNSCAGGVARFWVASKEDVATLTITGGEVTAITTVGVTKFYEFEPYQETGVFTETGERANCNTVINQTLMAVFPCHAQTTREAIQEMQDCCCGFIVIHEENNGSRWIWGVPKDLTTLGIHYPAQLTNFETTSGTAINDQNQTSITLTSRGTVQALPVDTALVIPV
jgi:hypothetical protein